MYDTFIGLEIHIHLLTDSKMFCGCKAAYGDEPNTNVCPVCMGYPGVLPTVNEKAMFMGYRIAQAFGCKLSKNTSFDRKNYFYPDMPKNYQISQFFSPVGENGLVEFEYNGKTRNIRIHDVHLEEDAGKMIHAGDTTLLDFNRAGYPLLEIVTEPDLKSGEEAEAFLRAFRRIVRYLGVCNGNMDEGSMKCDANVSINPKGVGLGTKVEIKNMNSPRFVRLAMNYEVQRQQECLENDKPLFVETRLWNENRDMTETMRMKEDSNDYRYFPEPDLPPFKPDEDYLKKVSDTMVELPIDKKRRFISEYKLKEEQAELMHEDLYTANFFEECIKLGTPAEKICAWLSSDVKKVLNRENMTLKSSPLTAVRLNSLITLIETGKISGKIAKTVLDFLFAEDKDPKAIVEEKGLVQINDEGAVKAEVQKVCDAHSDVVEAIKAGDGKQRGFLMGQVMKATGGKAAPALVQKILGEILS